MASLIHTKVWPTWRLRQRVTNWLDRRHWLLEVNTSPNLYFGLLAAEPDNADKWISIVRTKNDKDILAFTGGVPLDTRWLKPLSEMSETPRAVLIEDMHNFIHTMRMGFVGLEWPLDRVVVQHALPRIHRRTPMDGVRTGEGGG